MTATGHEQHFVVSQFDLLERQLLYCMRFIPYIPENKQVISPAFTPIILESCSLIDSVFKRGADDPNRRYSLKDYSEMVEEQLDLAEAISILLTPRLGFVMPFGEWKQKEPEWWRAHNQLKHDRINNYRCSTVENAILSLAALNQVLARDTDFTTALIHFGWFNTDSEEYVELVSARIAGARSPMMAVPVETRLFVSPLDLNFVVVKDGRYLVNEDCHFSSRVRAQLNVFEWFQGE